MILHRSCYLQHIIPDSNDSLLDVTPETNNLGTNVNINSETVGKVLVRNHDNVTLAVKFKVFVFPCLDCNRKERVRKANTISRKLNGETSWPRSGQRNLQWGSPFPSVCFVGPVVDLTVGSDVVPEVGPLVGPLVGPEVGP